MKTFLALASSVVSIGSMVAADPGDPLPLIALRADEVEADTSTEWLSLDRELGSLASGSRELGDGFGWSILLRGAFVLAHENIATNNLPGARNGNDVAGVDFNDLDVALWGTVRQYGWRVSFDILGDDETSSANQGGGNQGGLTFDTGDEIQLEDAYARWEWGSAFTVTAGNFKFPMTYSAGIDPENQLFIDRTVIGSHLDQWQAGIMFNGTWVLPQTICGGAHLRWYFGVQDGVKAAQLNTPLPITSIPSAAPNVQNSDSGSRYAFRLEYDMGNGVGAYEGARRSNDQFNATVGITWAQYETHTASDSFFSADLNGDYRALGFGFETAALGDSLGGALSGDYGHLNLNQPLNMMLAGGSNPWAIMLSYLVTPEWEVAVRSETLDNSGFPVNGAPGLVGPKNRIVSYVINWYRSGNNAKWQFGYTTIASKQIRGSGTARFDQGGYFQIGLTLGATR